VRTFGALLVAVGLAGVTLLAQSQTAKVPSGANYGMDPSYKVPRTPDGKPDLQGVWSNNSVTPLMRPRQWADRETISDAELKELQGYAAKAAQNGDAIFQNVVQLALDAKEKGKFDQTSYDKTTGNYNQFWMAEHDWDTRTALIIDPPNGMLPPLTPEGQKKASFFLQFLSGDNEAATPSRRPNGPEDLPLTERCMSYGAPRALQAGYNSYLQIVQSPEDVILQQEMIHDARVIPMDGRPHLPARVRQLHGDPRGRWEGDTLVIETTNYSDATMLFSSPDVKVTERLTRVSENYINWVVTFDDPATFTKPWSVMIRLKKTKELLYEYACHEGNYSMQGILAGARLEEQKEAAAGKKSGTK
jgi:hypothetical protein